MTIDISYQRAVWNLATETLPAAGWGDFRKLPEFPDRAQPDVKLEFLSRYLKHALAPQDIRANPNLRHEHIRGDLNKYRPWLLRVVLRHLYETHIEHTRYPLRLPEDLPKIIGDLHMFHKNFRLIAEKTGDIRKGSIQHYSTLEEFHKTMDLLRPPPSPLKPEEREIAFRNHLKEYGGDGGATLRATLNNGTMVIQLNTEAASIAFGSPHWCTAYQNQETYFEEYKDDLIMILAPDGRRHQLHFRKHQFKDANDKTASLPDTLNIHHGLAELLSHILRHVLENSPVITPFTLRSYLELCVGIPTFEDEIINARLVQKALKYAIKKGRHEHVSDTIYLCLKNQRFAETLAAPKGICQALDIAIYANNGSANKIIECAAQNPQLAEALAGPDGIPSALRRIVEHLPGKISHNDYKKFRKSCQLNIQFMTAIISPEGLPRLIKETAKTGNTSKLKSLWDEHENLREIIASQTSPTSEIHSAAIYLPAPVLQSMLSRYQP